MRIFSQFDSLPLNMLFCSFLPRAASASTASSSGATSSGPAAVPRMHCNLHLDFIADVRRALAERSRYSRRSAAVGSLGARLLSLFDSMVAARITCSAPPDAAPASRVPFDQTEAQLSWIGRRVMREIDDVKCVDATRRAHCVPCLCSPVPPCPMMLVSSLPSLRSPLASLTRRRRSSFDFFRLAPLLPPRSLAAQILRLRPLSRCWF